LASVQPDASGDWPSGPVSCHGVLSPRAVSGFAGTMMSQFALTAGGGAGALALGEGDGQGVADAVADADGDVDGLGSGEPVDDALGLGSGEAEDDALGLGSGDAVDDALGLGPAGAVADAVGAGVGSAAGPAVADAATVGPAQGSAGLFDELRRVLACGMSTKTRPAATTMASTAISAGYARI
jgi:hypothetical protein